MVVNTVGHLAAKGIINKDFELAHIIEQVIMWQPGIEEGVLEGTPSDAGLNILSMISSG